MESNKLTGFEIAIIGMSGRFPGAANVDEFWNNLKNGVDSVTFFTDAELQAAGIDEQVLRDPQYVKSKGIVEDYDCFDASFFDYVPADAELMDPQIRLFHECAWEALEEGGYGSLHTDAVIGVYAGASSNLLWEAAASLSDSAPESKQFADSQLTDKDFLSSRVSYKLNLKGPSVSIYTACSTSLVAVHMACQGLLNGECHMALAGGVSIALPQESGYLYQDGMIMSPDGHCRAFDKSANGTVGGSGAGAVLLKRLEDAIQDGDPIHAVIKGSAINNDGANKSAFSAPSIEEQSNVIRAALLTAEVSPESISYLEAHGTGTYIGDPVELEGLRLAFTGTKKGYCAIGSVKSNIGHLDCAAGIAGLIKTVQALKHKCIPPTLHVAQPNPQFDWIDSPFYINSIAREWTGANHEPLRAGVSSFGIGGTNAHVILEEAPIPSQDMNPEQEANKEGLPSLLVLSARTKPALERAAHRLADYLVRNPNAQLADVAYTLQTSRTAWECRQAFVCADRTDAMAQLLDPSPRIHAARLDTTAAEAEKLELLLEAAATESRADHIRGILEDIGRYWMAGANIDFAKIHVSAGRVLHLPTYPFERVRYNQQIELCRELLQQGPSRTLSLQSPSRPRKNTGKSSDISDWFYSPAWSRVSNVCFTLPDDAAIRKSAWVIVADEGGIGDSIAGILRRVTEEVYVVTEEVPCDFGKLPDKHVIVLHLGSVKEAASDGLDKEAFQEAQEKGLYSLLDQVRALSKLERSDMARLCVVTNLGQEITGNERIQAESASMKGACLVIAQEHPNLQCMMIDLDYSPTAGSAEAYAYAIIREAVQEAFIPVVGYRNGYRWKPGYEPMPLPVRQAERSAFQAGGVYCITGGFGKIGLTIAEYILTKGNANVVLIGRTPLPSRETWKEYLVPQESEPGIAGVIRWALRMEERGAGIMLLTADTAEHPELHAALGKAIERFGQINGIVHAAGVTNGKTFDSITSLDRARFEEQFQAKVYGLLALEQAVEGIELDFCILFSSLSTVLGGITFGAYAAANSFLDAYVYRRNLPGSRWISVDWDGWNVDGFESGDSIPTSTDAYLMAPEEALDALERILLSGYRGQLIVSTGDFEERLDRWVMRLREQSVTVSRRHANKLPRPALSSRYAAAENEIQQRIAEIWETFFGIQDIGMDDNFFELGGDSLKGATLIAGIQKAFHAELSIGDLFQYSTIRQMAQIVANAASKGDDTFAAAPAQPFYPLSAAQRRMYFMSQFYENDTNYNIPSAVTITGPLDRDKVERVFRKLIARHDMLRTSFDMRDGEPVQIVADPSAIRFRLDYAEKEPEQARESIQELIRPFDLKQAPLLRAQLIKLQDECHLLFMDMHHIISDGVSTGIIMSEFIELYQDRPLAPQPYQYKDFVLWQQQRDPESSEKKEAYWLSQYQDELPVLQLPMKPVPYENADLHADKVQFMLDRELTERLHALASRHQATLFMVLLAVYYAFLSKYTNQRDIVIGTASAGRQHDHAQHIVGMFVNTLPLRNYPEGDKRFADFLKEVKDNVLQAFEHQDYPFEELIQKLNVQRDLQRQPLIETMFVWQNIDFYIEAEDLTFASFDLPSTTSKYDFMFEAKEVDGEILCLFHYRTLCFDEEYVQQMSRHFRRLAEQCISHPERPLKQLEMLSREERERILILAHPRQCWPIALQPIQKSFESRVIEHPNRVALVTDHSSITYEDLNRMANRIAHSLLARPIAREVIVAILLDRSEKLVAAVLGTVKAGAAYLLIQPDLPDERIRFMLADSQVSTVITESTYAGRFSGEDAGLLLLDQEQLMDNVENPVELSHPAQLAYVMYTSGTTGTPKAVMIENRNIARLVLSDNYRILIQGNRMLQTASVMFDAFTLELWGMLTHGGTLVMLDDRILLDAGSLGKALADYDISDLFLTTSLFNQLAQQAPGLFSAVRTVLIGGEAASPYHVGLVRQSCPDTRLINGYGPTENTTFSTVHSIEEPCIGPIPIGYPLFLSQAYIVNPDQADQLQPIGVEGELCVAGDGIGRGYRNQPELTGQKFVPNPFRPGTVMYRTGDLARWLPNGMIEFRGRMDDQVKIRGYRIELEEIRACLLQHDQIAEAAVIPVADDTGQNKELCAYYTALDEQLPEDEVRRHAAEKLPRYMIPSFFVRMKELPLTANGKLNKRALPDPKEYVTGHRETLEPSTELERKLARLFSDVLEIGPIGRDCNFFEWGGHSLKAMQLVAKAQKELHAELTLRDLFRYPILQELAAFLTNKGSVQFSPIQPAEQKEHYPLSSAQKRLYILEQFEDIGTSYNMPFVLQVEGPLDIGRVRDSYRQLLHRHEILRTSFHVVNDEPVQRIEEMDGLQAELICEEAPEAGEAELTKRIEAFIRPFRLSEAPLIRMGIIRIGPEKHLLLLDMHHIISDGTSLNIWVDEFMKLYKGDSLAPLAIQYKDYAVWQQAQMTREAMRRQKEFWRNELSGEVPVLQLPTDYPRPAVQDFQGSQYSFRLGRRLSGQIEACCRESGVTLYMLLLAAYQVLLHKYTGQEDIIVGTPVAGRGHADLEGVLGMFVNTLAIRSRPQGDKTFSEFLQEVKNAALNAFEHPDYPFEELVQELNAGRDMSRNPLFDTMFALQNTGMKPLDIKELTCAPYPFSYTQANFDLSFQSQEIEGDIVFAVEYSTSLFEEDTIARMAGHYRHILESAVSSFHMPISELEWVPAEEKWLVLNTFNQPYQSEAGTATVSQMIEKRAAEAPDNIALRMDEETVTYRQLNSMANRLARHLRRRNLWEGSVAGILLPNSIAMIISLLAVQKAGAVCVPIDPDYPENRIAYMLGDAKAAVLITLPDASVPHSWSGETLRLTAADLLLEDERPEDGWGEEPGQEEESDLSRPDAVAYILYTSGTTGQPKGVTIAHSNLMNYIAAFGSYFEITEEDCVLHHSSVSFDTSIEEIYPALVHGASVLIVEKEVSRQAEELAARIAPLVTVVSCSPVLLSELNRKLSEHRVRAFIAGGDVLRRQHICNLLRQSRVFNSYGPTETTVCAAYHLCRDGDEEAIPIGKPIRNYRIYIVDRYGKLQPAGIPGELCIAGAGVTRGYWGKQQLTAERFVPDPFGQSGWMYRTGDLAKWDRHGNLYFLGRIDQQIKIRGYRVELQEVENVLGRAEGIKDAVAIARADINQFQRLYAFIVSDEPQETGALREQLQLELPDYMIPDQFIQVDRIPLTVNGKVDRRQLERMWSESLRSEKNSREPATAMEVQLLSLWKQALDRTDLGVQDNFFESGGHSLKATSLAVKIRQQLGFDLKLLHIFQHQTVRDMAAYLSNQLASAHYDDIVPVAKAEMYAISPAQKRMLLLSVAEGSSLSYNMPMALKVSGKLDPALCRSALQQIVNRHEILRTSFHFVDGEPVQKIHEEIELEWSEAEAADEQVEELIHSFIRPFRLEKASQLRAGLIKLSESSSVLLFDIHHIISDGMSMSILIQEFMHLYNGTALPDAALHYKDFAAWQHRFLASKQMREQQAFWLKQFAEEVPALQLPYDYPRPPLQSFAGDSLSFEADQPMTRKLRAIALQSDATLYMVLLASYYTLLFRYARQEDIVIGCPIAGRRHEQVEHMPGMFVNTLPLRIRLRGDMEFTDLLRQVRKLALEAYDNQDYPFDKLVELLNFERDLSRNPLFDTVFVMQNMDGVSSIIPGLKFEPRDFARTSTMFDIRFEVTEENEALFFTMDYCTSLFKAATMEQMANHFMNILQAVTRDPSIRLDTIELDHGYVMQEQHKWLETISFDF